MKSAFGIGGGGAVEARARGGEGVCLVSSVGARFRVPKGIGM